MMNHNPPSYDSTIADIHRTRERIAEKFGGDIAAILEDARRRQEAEGRPVWQQTEVTNPKVNDDSKPPASI